MKHVFTAALLSTALFASSTAPSLAAENPVFGTAKVQKLDSKQMKSVVGQGYTSAYYAYYGNLYANYALQYGSQGVYYEIFGNTYAGTRYNYYNTAASYAYNAFYYYSLARNNYLN
jgi:hypothetical protein